MAVEYEARRQIGDDRRRGGVIKQETRRYDSKLNETRSMRSKEEAHDYRYFPDPDLLPLELEAGWVKTIEKSLPELPDEKKARFIKAGLSAYDAGVIVAERELADYYDALSKGVDAKLAANWLNNEVLGRPEQGMATPPTSSAASAAAVNRIVAIVSAQTISGKTAKKDLLDIVWSEGGDPETDRRSSADLRQVTKPHPRSEAADRYRHRREPRTRWKR